MTELQKNLDKDLSTDFEPRPMPMVDVESEPYWTAARENELRVSRCADCGHTFFYARVACPRCHSETVELVVAGGLGTVYSYTVSRRAAGTDFSEKVPYIVALVDLDEGPRMLTNIVDADPDDCRIGARVSVRFLRISPEFALPVFGPVTGADHHNQKENQ